MRLDFVGGFLLLFAFTPIIVGMAVDSWSRRDPRHPPTPDAQTRNNTIMIAGFLTSFAMGMGGGCLVIAYMFTGCCA